MYDFKPIKLIIAGSREKSLMVGFTMMEQICKHFNFHAVTVKEVVSGMAMGVDDKGRYWAVEQKIPIKKFHADWDKYGKSAGPIRNIDMASYADALLLIWDGESRGSKNMLKEMRVIGKPVYEVIIKEPKDA